MVEQVAFCSSCVFYFVGGAILGEDFIKEVLMTSKSSSRKIIGNLTIKSPDN